MKDNEVTVSVRLSDNPGFSRFAINVNYDSNIFTPKKITSGTSLNEKYFDSNLKKVESGVVDISDINEVTATYNSGATNVDVTDKEANLFEVTFELKPNIPKGEYSISTVYTGTNGFESSDGITPSLGIFDSKGNQIMPQISDAKLKLEVENIKGDVNRDNRVDILDCVYLGCKMVNWSGLEWDDSNQQAADVFTDGRITPKDGTRLAQIIAGYDLSSQASVTAMSEDDSISLFSTSLDYINFSVENVYGVAGTEIDVPIKISDNTGISGYNFRVNYDKRYLTPISVIDGELYDENSISNLQQSDITSSDLDSVNVYYVSDTNIVGDGTLFTVRFHINTNVSNGQIIPITLSYDDGAVCKIKDNDLQDINISVKQGSIETTVDPTMLTYPFDITKVTMSSDETSDIQNIPQNGDFNMDLQIRKNEEISDAPQIILAKYAEGNTLISCQSTELTSDIIANGTCRIYIEPTEKTISYIKVFIWDSINGMKPLSSTYRVE